MTLSHHAGKRKLLYQERPEVGLFLGYPAEDVEGFIRDSRSAKYTGTWKVYGDVESAKRKFAQYRKCTRLYQEAYRKHNSFDRLIVNVK